MCRISLLNPHSKRLTPNMALSEHKKREHDEINIALQS